MFFSDWSEIGRIALTGVLIYVSLLALLRISGKRTLTKMNAFDLIVTVALGTIVGSTLLNSKVSWADGATALVTLVLCQYAITFTTIRMKRMKGFVKSEPTLLFFQGRMLRDNLRDQRLHEEEVRAAMRSNGFSLMKSVEAVILETDGSFSVLPVTNEKADTAVEDVKDYPPGDPRAPTDIQSNPSMRKD